MNESKTTNGKAGARPFWRGLAFRVAVSLALPLTVVLVAAGWFNLEQQRDHLERQLLIAAERCTDTIRSSTHDAMLLNRADQLNRILRDIGHQKNITRIRIYDQDGIIRRATHEGDLGSRVEERLLMPGSDPHSHLRYHHDGAGDRFLAIALPIENEAECSACHAPVDERPYLGGLEVEFPLKAIDEQLAESEVAMLSGLFVSLLAAGSVIGLLMWRLVVRPVKSLGLAADQVAAGDLQARVPVTGTGEMGEMAERWNNMVEELAATRDELENLNQDLEGRVADKTQELHDAYRRMMMVEKMASLGKLSAVVAHEINNPLAGITTYAKLLRRRFEREDQDEGATGHDSRRILKMVEEESARCGRIVQNLLLFSRAPTAKFAERDIGPIIERCALLVHHRAELQDVEIETEIAADLRPIVCDAAQIQQVVIDIMMNAIEAMPQGGHLMIAARMRDGGEGLEIEIADDGVGIAPDLLESIFEPFFTTKSEGHGVGLGLAVAYGIIERHGGAIEVESELGRGTSFHIRLPLEAPPENENRGAES